MVGLGHLISSPYPVFSEFVSKKKKKILNLKHFYNRGVGNADIRSARKTGARYEIRIRGLRNWGTPIPTPLRARPGAGVAA